MWALGCNSSLGGQPSPTPYSCGTPSTGHCYGEAFLGDHVTGFRTTITVAQRFFAGDGFVNNEFWITNYNGNNGWIEMGYQVNLLGQHYFWAQLDPVTSLYGPQHNIDDIPPQDIGARVTFDIHQVADDQFQLSMEGSAVPFATTVNLHLWDGTYGGTVKVGMELQGSTGAQASLAEFVDNQVYDKTFARHYVVETSSQSLDAPPYGGWLQQPSDAADVDAGGSPGGVFSTYCCAP